MSGTAKFRTAMHTFADAERHIIEFSDLHNALVSDLSSLVDSIETILRCEGQ